MPATIAETPTVGLGQLIQGGRFDVPVHQRDYAWTETEINSFFDDIEASLQRRDDLYFLGLMVFQVGDNSTLTILDGQQRLATTIIVLSAIRNWLQQYTEFRGQAQKIEDWFIGFSELGQSELSARLALNSANNETFNRFVIHSVSLNDVRKELNGLRRRDRNRPLLEAIILCHERIAKLASTDSPAVAAERLYNFVIYLRDTVSIVRLVVRSDDAAYTIFETLNDRGLDLSPLDLVKNYLFSRAEIKNKNKARVRDLEGRWAEMMAMLSDSKADVFLRAFWTSRHGLIQRTTLFGDFKKEYKEPTAALQVSIDMRAAAERYAALENPEDIIWSGHSEVAKETVRALKTIGAKQTHPVLLAALEQFDLAEMERLLRLLEVLIVRFQLIGSGRPGRLETTCGRLAGLVHKGEVKTATQALYEFRDVFPSDVDFERGFQTASGIENRKAQYLLNRLERRARIEAQPQNADPLQPKPQTIEHVLPKKPGHDWKSVIEADPDIVEDCATRLGNLCLLGAINKDLGGKGFAHKIAAYRNSGLILTDEVAEYVRWDRDTIEARQSKMAKRAVIEWRFA